jgi:hypothetical protein
LWRGRGLWLRRGRRVGLWAFDLVVDVDVDEILSGWDKDGTGWEGPLVKCDDLFTFDDNLLFLGWICYSTRY